LQLAINVLMIARHFRFEVVPRDYRLQFNPIPNMKPRAKLKFRIVEQLREVAACRPRQPFAFRSRQPYMTPP